MKEILHRLRELEIENKRLKAIIAKNRVQSYAYENFSKNLKNFIWSIFEKAEKQAREQVYEEDGDNRVSEIDDILNSMD